MSDERILFQQALGIAAPWQVTRVEFLPVPPGTEDPLAAPTLSQSGELHLYLDFPRGSRFPCAGCGEPAGVYDSEPDRC